MTGLRSRDLIPLLVHYLLFSMILLSSFVCYVWYIEAGIMGWMPKPLRYAVYTAFISWNAIMGYFAWALKEECWPRQLWLCFYLGVVGLLVVLAGINLYIIEVPLPIKRTAARLAITLLSPIPFLVIGLFRKLTMMSASSPQHPLPK